MLNENRFLGTFRGHNTRTTNDFLKILEVEVKSKSTVP